ncbi:Ig-like domain-containing protein [Paludisphaera mucosa]|uniref:Ig-like domain-containing protein n=1 Tax=Paludisphaera mucosa TaxID=3030827 RepID=A0ABT6F5I9_9BACT|nr:Ig-like domain-containing protein [Paludisphaera mucosa]MDG3002847.1 Ig-like domain-containing protein [Paludisphaera mucosa]
MAATPSAATYGELTTFTLAVASRSGLTPGGLVGFYDGGVLVGTAQLDAGGAAVFTMGTLTVGSHAITAIYAGDAYFLALASAPIAIDLARNDTSGGAIVSSDPQVYYGETVTLTATFSAVSAGSAMTGTVAFYDGDVYLGSAPLAGPGSSGLAASAPPTIRGQAVLPGARLAVGGHVVRAVYGGDANYAPVTSLVPVSVLVDPAGTSTSLGAATSSDGSTVLTAAVVATTPGDAPLDGAVSFYNGATLLGTAPVVNGSASLNVGALPLGDSTLRAVYTSADGTSSGQRGLDRPRLVGAARGRA